MQALITGEDAVHFINHFGILQAEFEFNTTGGFRVLDTVDINQVSIAAALCCQDFLQLLFLLSRQGRHLQAVQGHLQGTVLAQFQVGFVGALGVCMAFDDDFTEIIRVGIPQQDVQINRNEAIQQIFTFEEA